MSSNNQALIVAFSEEGPEGVEKLKKSMIFIVFGNS